MRIARGALTTTVVLLASAAAASANTYCVPTGGQGCTNAGALDLQSALTAAQTNPGSDTVKIAAGTYTPAACAGVGNLFNYSAVAGNPVTITGAGSGQTILTCTAGYDNSLSYRRILTLSGPATISGVGIQLPSGHSDRGLELDHGATATHIALTSDPSADQSVIGVIMIGGTLTDSSIVTPHADGGEGISASAGASIDRTSVSSGGTAIVTSDYPATTIAHAALTAAQGVRVDGYGSASIYDSTIDLVTSGSASAPARDGLLMNIYTNNGHPTLTARNISIGGTEPSASGFDVFVTASGAVVDGTLTDSVIWGLSSALGRSASSGATANLTTAYDDYPSGSYGGTGGGATTQSGPPLSTDPGFANPAIGDLRITAGSPLIDAGTPAPLSGEPATDLAGNQRILAGNGSCTGRRDIGAFEYVAPLPATAAATPLFATTGQPVAFHATGCSINPDVPNPTFVWTFDDGATAAGTDVSHAFGTPGVHHATVTDTDADGRTGQATAAVTIVVRPPALPRLSRLRLGTNRFPVRVAHRHSRERLGTTLSWTDTVAATTTVAFTRSAAGIVHGRSCIAPPRHLPPHPHRCTRTLGLGSFIHHDHAGANHVAFGGRVGRHLLTRGVYRMTLMARFGGRASRAVNATFTVTR